MNYEEFKEYIIKNIAGVYVDEMISEQVRLKGTVDNEEIERIKSCEVSIKQITKNNGIKLDALSIYKKGDRISPNIYLKPYYDSYLMGKPIDFIMTEIIFHYRNESVDTDDMYCIDLNDYEEIKDRIIVRLINKELNRELLKECPYIEYLDLAITFRYLVSNGKKGIATILISDKEFEEWGITIEELYRQALKNTVDMFPYTIEPLQNIIIKDINEVKNLPEQIKEDLELIKDCVLDIKIYLLTNDCKANGAGAILYDGVVRNFSEEQGSNIYILPSSLHEVMLVPEDKDTDPKFLKELLADANRSSVGLIDLLGFNVYYYNREKDSLTIYEAA